MEVEKFSPLLLEDDEQVTTLRNLEKTFIKQTDDLKILLSEVDNKLDLEHILSRLNDIQTTFSKICFLVKNTSFDKYAKYSQKSDINPLKELMNKAISYCTVTYENITKLVKERFLDNKLKDDQSFIDDQAKVRNEELSKINFVIESMIKLSDSMKATTLVSNNIIDNIESEALLVSNTAFETSKQIDINISNRTCVQTESVKKWIAISIVLTLILIFLIVELDN